MDTQNERVELVNATRKNDQEIIWKELDGRISQIETLFSGIRKGITALIFLCFINLIFNIDWKVLINDSKYDSKEWVKEYWNYSQIQEFWKMVVAIVISDCIIVWICKMCYRKIDDFLTV